MDWLLARQDKIQKKLAARHLKPGGLALYDLSSSYFEGTHCPLAKRGYNRYGKKGALQVNYGLVADPEGRPVAVAVREGNVADSRTFMPIVTRLREDFGIGQFVIVGDRGMISRKAIDQLRGLDGIAWITALKSASIRALVEARPCADGFVRRAQSGRIDPSRLSRRAPGCLSQSRTRQTARRQTRGACWRRPRRNSPSSGVRWMPAASGARLKIGLRVGKVVNRYKVAKHLALTIADRAFAFRRKAETIAEEAAVDGLYVIRTPVRAADMDAPTCVRNYKVLCNVERAFRCIKTIDLKVRPIHHRLDNRVRAHIFLCMLAYYVEWHMREAWRPLLFSDEDQAAKRDRDPVAPAERSAKAEKKAHDHALEDGTPAHSFATLMAELATVVRNSCRVPTAKSSERLTFQLTTTPNPVQAKAIDLIQSIRT